MNLSILGSSGSVGTQALDVARELNINIRALTANKSVDTLEKQAREFKPDVAVMTDEKAAADLKIKLADTNTKVYSGDGSLEYAASLGSADTVLNSLVGMVGLVPTLCAIEEGKTVALANKETLVAGGDIVMKRAREKGAAVLPVDSEHSAIFQCLQGAPCDNALKRIILTASGGPFFGKNRQQLHSVTRADALKHPNWNMGAKITIDSATMMNKGFEIIEAVHLFGVAPDAVSVVVHRESIIHSMIEYNDNSVIAQLGVPDMRIPIQYALTYPERRCSSVARLDLAKLAKLTFYEPDTQTFGCLDICRKAIEKGGLAPCAVNAANEMAVKLFLDGKIGFFDIERLARQALDMQKKLSYTTVGEVLECDRAARACVIEDIL